MRSIAVALVLSAGIIAQIALSQLDASPLWVAPASVLVGVVAACVATGGITWLSVIFGALGTLCYGWLVTWNPSVALIALSASWLAPRAVLTQSKRDLTVFAACAAPGAVVAGLVAAHFAGGTFLQHLASCVFAGAALAVSHVVVRVDAPIAHALRAAGRALEGEVSRALIEVADAHPSAKALPEDVRAPGSKWRALLRAADARVALRGAVGDEAKTKREELDAKIIEQAAALRPGSASGSEAAPSDAKDEEGASPAPTVVDEPEAEQKPAETKPGTPAMEALVP